MVAHDRDLVGIPLLVLVHIEGYVPIGAWTMDSIHEGKLVAIPGLHGLSVLQDVFLVEVPPAHWGAVVRTVSLLWRAKTCLGVSHTHFGV